MPTPKKKMGRPLIGVPVIFRTPTDLLQQIDDLAEDETRSRSNMILVLLTEAVKARRV